MGCTGRWTSRGVTDSKKKKVLTHVSLRGLRKMTWVDTICNTFNASYRLRGYARKLPKMRSTRALYRYRF